jgi:hypothetical protein
VAQEKSGWWPPKIEAIRFTFLMAVVTLLFTAGGALLFIAGVGYVATLNNRVLLILGAATALAAVVVLIRVGQHYEWTGLVTTTPTGRPSNSGSRVWAAKRTVSEDDYQM